MKRGLFRYNRMLTDKCEGNGRVGKYHFVIIIVKIVLGSILHWLPYLGGKFDEQDIYI